MSRQPAGHGDTSPPIYNGRYELSNQIARGGTAQVYLARDLLLDRPVALKVLFPELSSDNTFVDRFRREAQAAANLSHPNIVPVFDWGESERTYFIVMEYVDGEPLSSVIRAQAPLAPLRAASIGADICKALIYAHRHGVVHRDIKPGNVLLTRDGQVKVTDFGIARAVGADDNVTQTGLVMGTATYFSPEQAQGLGVDGRSDVYSLGVVLYEMATGRPPFTADTPVAIAYKHVSEAPIPPRQLDPSVPEALEAIILHAMAKQPGDRYATAEDLLGDLQRFVQGAPVLAGAAVVSGAVAGATATQVISRSPTTVLPVPADAPATAAAGEVVGQTEVRSGGGPEMPKRRWVPWAVAGLLLLALLGILIYYGGRQLGYFGASGYVHAPNVVGFQLHDAEAVLHQHGLRYTITPKYSGKPRHQVIQQIPGVDAVVKAGSVVNLVYSDGNKPIPVPNVLGQQYQTAEKTLKAHGFKYALLTTRPTNANQTQGVVVKQTPQAQSSELPGSVVTITYINGAQLVQVPSDLTGKTVGDASTELVNDQLKVGNTAYQTVLSATVPKGNVVTTSPAPGSTVPAGTFVNLIISGGPGVTVPPVVNENVDQASAAITALGLTVIRQYVTGSAAQANQVVSQNPAGGTQVAAGSPVTIVIDQGPATTTTTTPPTTTTTLPPTTTTTSLPKGKARPSG